ncbi:hypothetical protein [Basilea psittacipulmonis]|uniref:Uncharacterized protein n=1 Tax=Basilea psittacipulmonis DSM 24701 TaxID=1072685 RepID=A0A077DEK0_9BURK|nr:hypothetical protein [Basilea psittacipulmonis]AIL33159.1 hypothetical protein IX83_07500 [Basilea psittacipulmonis DSM 24701]
MIRFLLILLVIYLIARFVFPKNKQTTQKTAPSEVPNAQKQVKLQPCEYCHTFCDPNLMVSYQNKHFCSLEHATLYQKEQQPTHHP